MPGQAANEEVLVKIGRLEALDEERRSKLIEFLELCKERKQEYPDYVVCAPGRVNLIGDHIDYHGFSVLPMAIGNFVMLGCSLGHNKQHAAIGLHNKDAEMHSTWVGPHSFSHGWQLKRAHKWHNYILCAYHGVLTQRLLQVEPAQVLSHANQLDSDENQLQTADQLLNELVDFQVFVDSNLPQASGLSSSSALVCGAAVATSLMLNQSILDASSGGHLNPSIKSAEMADSCSKFEQLVGTRGGGMDQAVIMTAQEGYAKFVEFAPKLKCENVRLPDNIAWLVSHCGVNYSKAETKGFNTRVLETKLAAALIAKIKSASDKIPLDSTITLGKIKNELFRDRSVADLVKHLQTHVFQGKNEYTVVEICSLLELTEDQLIERFETSAELLESIPNSVLQLMIRCEHVLEEAERVEKFRSICDTTTDVVMLGQLMTQSHYSLRDKYDCSHPALDRLVSVSLDAGALGSRLTGAGWGGCIVSLVERPKCDTVFKRLREVSKFTFRTEPQAGCFVIKLDRGRWE